MDALFKVLLTLHVVSGFTALIIGVVPMVAKKGGKLHKKSGLIYFWAMFGVFITSVPMAFIKWNIFLFTIGIFSFYFVLTGYRFAKRKGWHLLTSFDKGIMLTTFTTSILMIGYSAYLFYLGSQNWIILGIFGIICFLTSIDDLRKFGKKSEDNKNWFYQHLIRMLGGYIATSTAFVVTNLTFLPPLIGWLAPTVIGSIGITLTMIHYKRKFKS